MFHKKFILYSLVQFTILFSIYIIYYTYSFQKSYNAFTEETPIANIYFKKLDKNKYMAYLTVNNKNTNFIIYGNQWRLDVEFKKFKYFANLLNVKSKYMIDRLEGRYKDIKDENTKKHQAYDLNFINNETMIFSNNEINDLLLDTTYGSSVYKDIKINKKYIIYKTNNGILVREEILPIKEQKNESISSKLKKIFF
jgi:hypothetical protein